MIGSGVHRNYGSSPPGGGCPLRPRILGRVARALQGSVGSHPSILFVSCCRANDLSDPPPPGQPGVPDPRAIPSLEYSQLCALRPFSKYIITTLCRQYNCAYIKYWPIAQITTPQCYRKVTLIEPCGPVSGFCGPVILLWSGGMSLWRSSLCDRHSAHSAHSDPTVLLMQVYRVA